MVIAIVIGAWTLISIIGSPLIGRFLFALNIQEQRPQRSAADSRFRPSPWNYPALRQQENLRRLGPAKFHRREAKSPRAG